ncbi:MAG: hypothetical protein RJB08_272 [Actinomycetota bacterium]|jgi:hypothetical protein
MRLKRNLGIAALVPFAFAFFDGCGSPRSVDDLAAALLTNDDLSGEWTLNLGTKAQDQERLPESGLLSEEQRKMLPTVHLCEAADASAQKAADRLHWDVYRQLDKKVADPVDVPKDRVGNMVFVQESMLLGKGSTLANTLDDLFPGIEKCLGPMPASEEGPGDSEKIAITASADQKIGVLYTVEEAGGAGTWHVYNAILRKGSVVVSVMATDIALGGVDVELGLNEFDTIVSTALAKL